MYFFLNSSTIPQLSNLDHLGLSLLMKHCNVPSVSHPRRTMWRYNLADFDRANKLLCDLEIDELLDPASIQRSWKNLKAAFLDVMEQCIPNSVLPQKRRLPWLTREYNLSKNETTFTRKPAKSGNDNFPKFKQLQNKVAELRLAKRKICNVETLEKVETTNYEWMHYSNFDQREYGCMFKFWKSRSPKHLFYQQFQCCYPWTEHGG